MKRSEDTGTLWSWAELALRGALVVGLVLFEQGRSRGVVAGANLVSHEVGRRDGFGWIRALVGKVSGRTVEAIKPVGIQKSAV